MTEASVPDYEMHPAALLRKSMILLKQIASELGAIRSYAPTRGVLLPSGAAPSRAIVTNFLMPSVYLVA